MIQCISIRKSSTCLLVGLLGAALSAGGPLHAQQAESEQPPLELQRLEVKKDKPTEEHPTRATIVTLWVKDTAGTFSSILEEETQLESFRDDQGTNLMAAHRQRIRAWKEKKDSLADEGQFISIGREKNLYRAKALESGPFSEGGPGFYITFESWATPAPAATELRLSGQLRYLLGRNQTQEIRRELTLADKDSLSVAGYPIRIVNKRKSGSDKQQFMLETPLHLTTFELRNEEGESFGGLGMYMGGRPAITVPRKLFHRSETLVVEYQVPMERTLKFDQRVQLGL
jgi:hypothetical protein